ncbi:hypothetical protein AKJ38_02290 [candidate division MSBL1 archaeon SCGC-AAA259I14]|uniref:Uncharacterized protein n=1 Tax=candidate division MSBL1 archaeon SCGC-AAA259I14 TaxID=1698268 RepID=A0A133URT0_9EURY|nr:hypothetical protein AKJ38_02290 [candidate division MSBL1 archaeon SCGC-AAA259I14]
MRSVEYEKDDIELTSMVRSAFRAIERLEIVGRVVVEGENTPLVEFNAWKTWDSVVKPMKVALDYSCVVVGYESASSGGIRYRIVPNDSKEVEVHPERKKDFEVANLKTLKRRRDWVGVIQLKPSMRKIVSDHKSESEAKRWLLGRIKDLSSRESCDDEKVATASVARRTAGYREISVPLGAERIFYCKNCRRSLLDGPERTACKLAGHSMLGENDTELLRAGNEMFFRTGGFTGRLVQNTSTKVVHALAIDEVFCSAECGDFSEGVDLDEGRLCKQCRRKIVE